MAAATRTLKPLHVDLVHILDAHEVPHEARRVLQQCLLLTPARLGMVKPETRLDRDVISRIQWECDEMEILGHEMALKCAWHDCQTTSPQAVKTETAYNRADNVEPRPQVVAVKVEAPKLEKFGFRAKGKAGNVAAVNQSAVKVEVTAPVKVEAAIEVVSSSSEDNENASDNDESSAPAPRLNRLKAADNATVAAISGELQPIDKVTHALSSLSWPDCIRRPNVQPSDLPSIHCFTLGLTCNWYGNEPVISRATRILPDLAKLLTGFVGFRQPGFEYTSITLNKGYACKLHVDASNQGPSIIIGLGDYGRGGLWLFDTEAYEAHGVKTSSSEADCASLQGVVWVEVTDTLRGWPQLKVGSWIPGRVHDVKHRETWFDGNLPHMTMPFDGVRYSLVYFTRTDWHQSGDREKVELRELGFHLPRIADPPKPCRRIDDIKEELLDQSGDDDGEELPQQSEDVEIDKEIVDKVRRIMASRKKAVCYDLELGKGVPILLHGLCQIGKSWEITVAAWLSFLCHDAVPVVLLLNTNEAEKQFRRCVRRFNDEVLAVLKEHCVELTAQQQKSYLLSPVKFFSPEHTGAQLVMKLTNVGQIRNFIKFDLGAIPEGGGGKLLFTLISDESDLDIQSATGSGGGAEKLVRTLQSQAWQQIGVTATIAAQAFTAKQRLHVVQMPIPENYFGFSQRVPEDRRPSFVEASSDGFEGITEMVRSMLEPGTPTPRVALIHTESEKKAHARQQEQLAEHFTGAPLLILTHNGGDARKRDGISAMTSLGDIPEQRRLLQQLATCTKRDNVVEDTKILSDSVRLSFRQCLTIAEMLSAVRVFTDMHNMSVCIISGHMGGRAVTFKCTDHLLHLTDMFVAFPRNAHAEHVIQVANRISGTYDDLPNLQLWTTKEHELTIRKYHDVIDQLSGVLIESASDPDELSQLWDDLALDLPHSKQVPLLTRQNVEKHFRIEIERKVHGIDGACKHGGLDITNEVESALWTPEAHVEHAVSKHYADVKIVMVDEVLERSLLELGLAGSMTAEDLANYPNIVESLQKKVREALKAHFNIKVCYQVRSECGCSRRGLFPLDIVKRDYYEAAYGWDAERERFIVLRRVKSWDEVQSLKTSATQNDVVVWRALRAHAGKRVEMDMMVRHILAKETEAPKVKILRQWALPCGGDAGNAGFSHSGSSGGRCTKRRKCGNCHNCNRPSSKRKCLGEGGTREHAEADDEVRKRRRSIKQEEDLFTAL